MGYKVVNFSIESSLKLRVNYWFLYHWTLLSPPDMKPFSSDWDWNPHGWDSNPAKTLLMSGRIIPTIFGKVKVKLLSRVRLFAVAHHAPPSMGFSRQEHWSGLPFASPGALPDPG